MKAADAEEQVAGRHVAAVIGKTGDLHAGGLAGQLGRDQPVESHALMLGNT